MQYLITLIFAQYPKASNFMQLQLHFKNVTKERRRIVECQILIPLQKFRRNSNLQYLDKVL